MYRVKVISSFSAAHFLRNYKGKCENLHGHNWKVEAICRGEKLDSQGLVIDFGLLKDKLDSVLEQLDHKVLNEIDYFKDRNPTSEEIASYIFSQLKERLIGVCKLEEIRVWEKDNSCAIYQE